MLLRSLSLFSDIVKMDRSLKHKAINLQTKLNFENLNKVLKSTTNFIWKKKTFLNRLNIFLRVQVSNHYVR